MTFEFHVATTPEKTCGYPVGGQWKRAGDHLSMWRALLIDRFKLVAHLEKRTRPAYDLVLARAGSKLGPGLTRVAIDCDAVARRAEQKWR